MKTKIAVASMASLALLAGCVSTSKYDAAVEDARRARTQLAKEKSDLTAEIEAQRKADAWLAQQLELTEQQAKESQKLLYGTMNKAGELNEQLEVASASNEVLRKELDELTARVDKLAGEKGALAKDLEQTRQRLAELRRVEMLAQVRLAFYQDLAAKLRAMVDAGDLQVGIRHGRMVMRLPNDVLFDSGSVEIKPAGKTTLTSLAAILKGIEGRRFQIAGHTDDVPIHSGRFASNWDLSTSRAVEVVRFLAGRGVPPAQLSAAGYGEYDPLVANDSPGRAKNRRIEVIVQPNLDELQSLPNPKLMSTR